MRKTDWQYLVDTFLFICILGIALIGILLAFVVPQGPSAQPSSKYFLNLHRHQWGNIHLYLSLAFICLVIIHLTLDWKWIKAKAGKIFKKRWKTALISTVLASIFVVFLFWLFYPKEPGAYEEYGRGEGRGAGREGGWAYSQETDTALREALGAQDQSTITITGTMTLLDLENATGIPVSRITEALGLPSKVSEEETLGRLRKKYGFTMIELRDALNNLLNEKQAPFQKVQDIEDEKPLAEEPTSQPIHGRMEDDQSGILVTGQMSLSDIQEQTGISARKIANELGLPPGVPLHESLGQLRKSYPFTVQDVRDAVSNLLGKEGEILDEIPESETRIEQKEEEHHEEQKITRGRMAEDQSGLLITGQMSLFEIESRTGVPASKIIEKLRLPPNVSRRQNIGRLRRQYGFTLQDVRDIVASLMKKN
jgi:LysM repeat protein